MWQDGAWAAEGRMAGQAADQARFEEAMARHQRQVLGVALRLLGNLADAQDAAQEVFFRLYKHRGSVQPGGEGAWLYRVTVNVCHDLRRRRPEQPLETVPEPGAACGTDGEIDFATRREIVRRALRQLPERERAALVLRDVEGLSTAETAAALGSSEATVRSQISTARARLRQICEGLLRRRA